MIAALSILTVPAFDDNYLWIVHNGYDAIVVDPGDADAILQALAEHQLNLRAILLTHHHADHIGGVSRLLERFSVPVYGPRADGIASVTHDVNDNETLVFPGLPFEVRAIAVPGHTLGHIAYFAAEQAWLFCGDTLFAGGCGRLFEGTPSQMLDSLDRLAALPDDTLIFCAHEYTLSNLRFAKEVDPTNPILQERLQIDAEKRTRGTPTVPSRLDLEKQTNPFLRSREKSVRDRLISANRAKLSDDDATYFAALREWKNHYK